MVRVDYKTLLEAGVHFGHLKRKWNPSMAPYIFMEKNGIHIIDLHKTVACIETACNAIKQMTISGKRILFVATKKQAKEMVANMVKEVSMPYVTERWPGGMLTNFSTIRRSVRKMASIDKMATDGTMDTMNKKERLMLQRQRAKLEKNLGSIAELTRLPSALFVVDIIKEHIAVAEARKLNIPVFAIVDTNSDPRLVDFPIPANDDASKSIEVVLREIIEAVKEGFAERKANSDKAREEKKKEEKLKEEEALEREASAKKWEREDVVVDENVKGKKRKKPAEKAS